MKPVCSYLPLLLVLLLPTPALALLSNPQIFPAQVNVALNRTARIQVTWRMTTDAGPTVESPSGVLSDGSNVFLTVNRYLSTKAGRAGTDPATGQIRSQTVSLRETLILPSRVLSRAYGQSATRLYYNRQFSDANGSLSLVMVLNITGSSAAGFSINGLVLRFEDGRNQRLVDQHEHLRATARVLFSGVGRLQGVWEVAGPSTSSGSPLFRPLGWEHQTLFGGQEAILRSPPLPTVATGLYRLRFRVTQPRLDPVFPELRYRVRGLPPGEPESMDLYQPPAGATVGRKGVFRWQPVQGAEAYLLEIRRPESPGGMAVAGKLVKAPRNSLTLPPPAWKRLRPGERYLWRVSAMDAAGRILGRSEERSLSWGDGMTSNQGEQQHGSRSKGHRIGRLETTLTPSAYTRLPP